MTSIIMENIKDLLINEMKIAKDNENNPDWEPNEHHFTTFNKRNNCKMRIRYSLEKGDRESYAFMTECVKDEYSGDDAYMMINGWTHTIQSEGEGYDKPLKKMIKRLNFVMSVGKCECHDFTFNNDKYCNNCKWTLKNLGDCPICLEVMYDSPIYVIKQSCGSVIHKDCYYKNHKKCVICRIVHDIDEGEDEDSE